LFVSHTFKLQLTAVAFAGCLFAVAGAPIAAQTTPDSPSVPTVKPTTGVEKPEVTARAKDALHRIQTNDIDRSQFSNDFVQKLSSDQLTKAGAQLAAFGDAQQFQYDSEVTQGDQTAYLYHVTLQKGRLDEIIAVDQSGKISGLLFRNAQLNDSAPPPAQPR
jgi:hypothetical protein